jgi:hypothetical protein
MATVRISGNWCNPNKLEWGGALTVDADGHIERLLDLPKAVYAAIEQAMAKGENEGAIYLQDGTRFQWFLDR